MRTRFRQSLIVFSGIPLWCPPQCHGGQVTGVGEDGDKRASNSKKLEIFYRIFKYLSIFFAFSHCAVSTPFLPSA
jgi:hypothetical protein